MYELFDMFIRFFPCAMTHDLLIFWEIYSNHDNPEYSTPFAQPFTDISLISATSGPGRTWVS